MPIEHAIKQYLVENILFTENGFAYPHDASFMDEGIIDSMGMLELMMFVEETYGFAVPRQDLTPDNFDSVDRLATYIRQRLAVAEVGG